MDLYSVRNDHLQVVVAPHGAEIQSIKDFRTQTEYLWQGDPRYWADRSPLLFPIIGRIRNGVYSYEGKTYSMEMPHGFLQSRDFQPTSIAADRIALQTTSTPETLLQYPFAFRFTVEYRLVGASLEFLFQIENKDERPTMPFSLGTHPGFRVPLADDEKFEDYRLMFEHEEHPQRVELDGVFLARKASAFTLQSNRFLPLCHRLFDHEAIILGEIQKKSVSLIDPAGTVRWTLHFDDFDYLTLWQPADAPFVCLECWNGLPDPAESETNELARKPGGKTLASGETARFSLRISFP